MRAVLILMLGATAGVAAAIFLGARAELERDPASRGGRHSLMPDVTSAEDARDG